MVSEVAFGQLKSRLRVFHKKCESDKESIKVMVLPYVVLHNMSIDRGDLVSRVLHLSYHSKANKCQDK